MIPADPPYYRLLLQPIVAAMRGRPTVPAWITQAALHAVAQGYAHAITARGSQDLYLARYWLSTPRHLAAPDHDAVGSPFESGDSLLLHAIVRADDDDALHDHPWDFSTEILHGGYHEAVSAVPVQSPADLGPDGDQLIVRAHAPGTRRAMRAEEPHAICEVLPQTWTLVATGPRRRTWGFRAPGAPWIGWKSYLAERAAGAS